MAAISEISLNNILQSAVAQLVECKMGDRRVASSSLTRPNRTKKLLNEL